MKSISKTLILTSFLFFGLLYSASASTVTKTLYAWVKDQAGNVSISQSANVDITLPTTITPTVTFSGDWESGIVTGGYDSHNWGYIERMAADRYSLINGGARQGSYMAKVEVRPGDNPIAPTSPLTERSEVSSMRLANGTRQFENESSGTVQYAFSTKFDSTWQQPIDNGDGAGKYIIFFQLHPEDSLTGASPTFAFSATDQIRVALRGGDVRVNPKVYYDLSDGTLNVGNWIDWKFTVRYRKDSTGYVVLERRNEGQSNFSEVLRVMNVPTLSYAADTNGGAVGNHYIKYGIYRNKQTFTSILYNDGFTRSTLPDGTVLGASIYHFTLNLKQGSVGNEVKELQKILISKKYLSGAADGIYGNLTKQAVIQYQKDHNLDSDGLVGLKTRAVLNI